MNFSAHDEPLIGPGETPASIDQAISRPPLLHPAPRFWWTGFLIGFAGVMALVVGISWLFLKGIGIWGVGIPVAWAYAITNFVWWIGIGHAGTFISAFLLLLHQQWRTSINRMTEAMTLFAVACAGMFPVLHMGRPQYFYWLLPYPDTMRLWPQWRSPLVWDVFAVSTYFTVSLIFWYVGLIPDLATLRDRARSRAQRLAYAVLSLGWRGEMRHWRHYEKLYLLLAGLATPLVVSVHSVVSMDFAVAILPGWHSSIFPPYFVAGAIFSGFAMVLTLAVPIRAVYGLKHYITDRHLELMCFILMATGWIVNYAYFSEFFMAWMSGDTFERAASLDRALGGYAGCYWILVACNCLVPQTLWFRRLRRSPLYLFFASLLINVGMWTERYVIIVQSLHRDFVPSSWGKFLPTRWDWDILLGSAGLFVTLMWLFLRFLPAISSTEMKRLLTTGEQTK